VCVVYEDASTDIMWIFPPGAPPKRVAGKQKLVELDDINTVYLFDCKPEFSHELRLDAAFTVVFTSSNTGLRRLKKGNYLRLTFTSPSLPEMIDFGLRIDIPEDITRERVDLYGSNLLLLTRGQTLAAGMVQSAVKSLSMENFELDNWVSKVLFSTMLANNINSSSNSSRSSSSPAEVEVASASADAQNKVEHSKFVFNEAAPGVMSSLGHMSSSISNSSRSSSNSAIFDEDFFNDSNDIAGIAADAERLSNCYSS
jgi:hypothetical protein